MLEGGLTTGVSHEARISAYGLGLGNLIYLVDWNDFGIDDQPFSDIKAGNPADWFEPYGWKVAGTENGDNWESILIAFEELFKSENPDQPKAIWMKTRKGKVDMPLKFILTLMENMAWGQASSLRFLVV